MLTDPDLRTSAGPITSVISFAIIFDATTFTFVDVMLDLSTWDDSIYFQVGLRVGAIT
jgi:hypothetical protein